jgi:hypothetical protein
MPKSARALKHIQPIQESEAQAGAETPLEIVSPKQRAAAIAWVKKDARPLLIGAGLGAAAALAVVAARAKQRPTVALFASPNSTFLSAAVKVAVLVIGRTIARRGLANVVTRAVGQAVP